MSRKKLFIENFFAYGFINVLNKIIPFILLPVITRMLENPSDYGIYDMYNTIIGVASPLAMLGMYDSMFREYFEKKDQMYKFNVTTTASKIVLIASLITGLMLIVFNKAFSNILYKTTFYGSIVIFSGIELIISNNCTIYSAPTRIEDNKKIYVLSGMINSLAYYALAIFLIYIGFSFYSMIYANIIASLLLCIFYFILNRRHFVLGKFDKTIAKELLSIGIPLVPTFLVYWIYNSMDKIMITNILGINELGVYSIGAKVASVSTLIYYAFAGGWQYFAFSTMKDEDQIQLTSNIFEYLALISYISLIIIYPFINASFKLLFNESYINGYVVVPYLYLGPLLLMLFQVAANQFIVMKKSYFSTISLCIGAIFNLILNIKLIPILGIEGASIATLAGYALSVLFVCILTSKLKLLNISRRFVFSSLNIIIYIVISRVYFFEMAISQILLSFIFLVMLCVIYVDEIKYAINKKFK